MPAPYTWFKWDWHYCFCMYQLPQCSLYLWWTADCPCHHPRRHREGAD